MFPSTENTSNPISQSYHLSSDHFAQVLRQIRQYWGQTQEPENRVYDLGTDFTREEFYDQFGYGSTFPQVVVDNKNLGGCIDAVKYLREQKII